MKPKETPLTEKEVYKPGTKRGTEIIFERNDEALIEEKKACIATLIQQKMKEKNYSLRDLEKMTNIYNPQIHNIVLGKTNYKIETLLRILITLDMDIV